MLFGGIGGIVRRRCGVGVSDLWFSELWVPVGQVAFGFLGHGPGGLVRIAWAAVGRSELWWASEVFDKASRMEIRSPGMGESSGILVIFGNGFGWWNGDLVMWI